MRKNRIIILMFVFIASIVNGQSIDTQKSKISFEIGNMKLNTVEGTFLGMSGKIIFNPSDISTAHFEVCVEAASVNTGNEKRDDHLRKEDFFDVEQFPTICIRANSIVENGEGFLLTGELTMHGVTKNIEIPFTFISNTFRGALEVSRFDYSIGEDTSKFMVSENVEISIICILK